MVIHEHNLLRWERHEFSFVTIVRRRSACQPIIRSPWTKDSSRPCIGRSHLLCAIYGKVPDYPRKRWLTDPGSIAAISLCLREINDNRPSIHFLRSQLHSICPCRNWRLESRRQWMQIKRTVDLVAVLGNRQMRHINPLFEEIDEAIKAVDWPPGSGTFTINPIRTGNGVKPIKISCMQKLSDLGWNVEYRLSIVGLRPGPIDAVKFLPNGEMMALEWETGNISSSHRAINKMILGMLHGKLTVGVLVLPSRKMYRYLTDRIGNFQELEPYFPVWRNVHLSQGFLRVIEIEHDAESKGCPKVPKGTDGWSKFQ